jgi:hypothetical protein
MSRELVGAAAKPRTGNKRARTKTNGQCDLRSVVDTGEATVRSKTLEPLLPRRASVRGGLDSCRREPQLFFRAARAALHSRSRLVGKQTAARIVSDRDTRTRRLSAARDVASRSRSRNSSLNDTPNGREAASRPTHCTSPRRLTATACRPLSIVHGGVPLAIHHACAGRLHPTRAWTLRPSAWWNLPP